MRPGNSEAVASGAIEPYSAAPRQVVVKPLSETLSYAFDYSRPRGVVLLKPSARNRLVELLGSVHSTPDLTGSSVDRSLIRAGLLSSHKLDADLSSPKLRPSTLSVWLQVVHGCNFSCHYCYVPTLPKNVDPREVDSRSMGIEDFRIVVSRLIDHCVDTQTQELHLKFAGGEPTLNLPRIREFCQIARDLQDQRVRLSFGMISNGSFDLALLLPLLEDFKISLSLSLDGIGATHDAIRFEVNDHRRIGSWDTLSANIDGLIAAGHHPYVLFTLTENNYKQLDTFSSFVHERRLGYRLSLVRSSRPVPEPIQRSILEALLTHYERLGRDLDPSMPISRFARFAEWDLRTVKRLACSTCRGSFAIDQKAQVSPCQMSMDRPLGDLRSTSLKSMIELRPDTAAGTLFDPSSRAGTCSKCEYFHVCAGGCPQHTLRASGSLDAPSPWCSVFGGLLPRYIEAIASQMSRAVAQPSA